MKKLLLIIVLIIAGLNCQAQNVDFKDVPEFKEVKQRISQLETGRSVQLSVLKGLFNQMLSRVASLEKQVKELENNCIVAVLDSIPGFYRIRGDSAILEYDKRWKLILFKEINGINDSIISHELFKSKYIKIEKK